MMSNLEIAAAFGRLATMLEIDGANPFRVRAYREAARIVEAHGEPVAAMAERPGALENLPGIGKDLAGKIRELAATGTLPLVREMEAKIPPGVLALTSLPGLGPKRVKTLMDRLGIRGMDDLGRAAREGRLRALPGFGEKVEQNVIKALDTADSARGRMKLAAAWTVAHDLARHVRGVAGVAEVAIAGSFRRGVETVGDLDLLAAGGSAAEVMAAFVTHPAVLEVLGRGDTRSSVRLRNGLQVDLRHVAEESFGAALVYFTGSKAHNIELRKIALERGLSLNEYGLKRGDRTEPARTEPEVYRRLGLPWIPPELREGRGEIELARAGRLPRLIEVADIAGDLHVHTDRTDGRDSLEAMVRAAKERGYAYVAITDHSKALAMAGGFDAARVRRSAEEIAAVRRAVPGIDVLHGIEVDILADGALDLEDEVLDSLDWVVASLHSRLDQEPAVMTERVLRALDHPAVGAMGHPTSRMIGARAGVSFDLERVFERAARNRVALEISAQPHRLDLSDVHARLAREKGASFVINTDAHGIGHYDFMPYGVLTARRAGLTRDDVLNTRAPAALRRELAARRSRRGTGAAADGAAAAPAPARARASRPTAPRASQAGKTGTRPRSASPARKRAAKPLGKADKARPRRPKPPRGRP